MRKPVRKIKKKRVKRVKSLCQKCDSQARFKKHLLFEDLLIDISTSFISVPSDRVDETIRSAQERICGCLEIDICALWQFLPDRPEYFHMTHIHVPPDFSFEIPKAMKADESFPWCLNMVKKKKIVVLSNIDDAPTEAARDKDVWRHFGIKSSLTFPLFAGKGATFGALTFSMFKKRREWSQQIISELRIVSQVFANALNRNIAEKNLPEGKARLKLAADSANAGLWSWDYETGEIWVTEKTCSLYGFFPDEEVTGDRFFSVLHPDDLKRIGLIVEKSFREGTAIKTEYRIVLPDKSVRWISAQAKSLLKPSGKPDKMMGVSLDITERKHNETERAQLRLELAHMARVLTMNELSTSLAHEINQPLGAVLNNASAAKLLISKLENGPGELGDILEDIIEDCKRAGDVIRKVRGIVKKGDARFEPLDINIIINDVLGLIQNNIRMNNVSLCLDLSLDPPEVLGDSVRLRQVLLNIVNNAMEAMKKSPSKILTVRSMVSKPDNVIISVSDSGDGIDEGKKEKIFEPFYTTKKDGIGLGLRICRSIVEEHGGRIWVEDNPGGGVTFSFSLKTGKEKSS